jgi:hypothetical protein
MDSGSGIDSLNPQSAEISFLGFSVAISVRKTFVNGIFGYGPHVFAATPVTTGHF